LPRGALKALHMGDGEVWVTARINKWRQLVIPKLLLKEAGLTADMEVVLVTSGGGEIRVRRRDEEG